MNSKNPASTGTKALWAGLLIVADAFFAGFADVALIAKRYRDAGKDSATTLRQLQA